MKFFPFCALLCWALLGCADSRTNSTRPVPEQVTPADRGAGLKVAERGCMKCHGLDGKGTAPAIPHIAGQGEQYLLAALAEYEQGKRVHAPLAGLLKELTQADRRNVVAYYANLPPQTNTGISEANRLSPYEEGKKSAQHCARCHGSDGNGKVRGTPSLAGQQPRYLVAGIDKHHQVGPVKNSGRASSRERDRIELENLALYFASQPPVRRSNPDTSDAEAGEALSGNCGGCHGSDGVSNDAATPSLAGQDLDYLVKAIRAYQTARVDWGMHRYVSGLRDRDVRQIATFYAAQQPRAAEPGPTSTQELAEKCNRCHAQPNGEVPDLRGQDKDYLIMALRAYRDGKRLSSTMHNISFPYSNTLIESLATWYAGQPAK